MLLSEKIETHTGGNDWALRVEIAEALGWTSNSVGGVIAWYSPEEPERMRPGPPKWLTSLDAAMTLVPEGWKWSLDCEGDCHIWRGDVSLYGVAATPELALTAVALKSRGL